MATAAALLSLLLLLLATAASNALKLPVRYGLATLQRPRAVQALHVVDSDELSLPPAIQRINQLTIEGVKLILQSVYKNRPYAQFAALETIARVPYFSYTSVLHLYETLGWFRKKEYIQVHFAESWNELHHLLIMETLGGSDKFADRLVAQNIAFVYYWVVVLLYMAFPAVAYDLNKHVELHAAKSYSEFLFEHAAELKQMPAPQVAVDYYEKGDRYMFDAFHYSDMRRRQDPNVANTIPPRRRPVIENLYDVFVNIHADEVEHADTMRTMQREITAKQKTRP